MASSYLGYDNWLEMWEASGTEHENLMQRYMKEGIDKLEQEDSSICKMFKEGEAIDSLEVEWMEEWQYATEILGTLSGASSTTGTLTFSGNLMGQAVSENRLKKIVRVGTVFENTSTWEQYKVTSIAGLASNQVTVAVHGSTNNAVNDSTAVTYTRVGEPWNDTRDAEHPRSVEPERRWVGTQIFERVFTIPKTRENTRYYNISNESERQFAALMKDMQRELSYSKLRMKPTLSAGEIVYGKGAEDPTMCGLLAYPALINAEQTNSAYMDMADGQMTQYDVNLLLRNMMLNEHIDFGTGKWIIAMHPLVHRIFTTFDASHRRQEYHDKTVGHGQADTFDSDIGYKFPLHSDRYWRPRSLMVLRVDNVESGYYKNDAPTREEMAKKGRYKTWEMSFQRYGMVFRNPRQSQGFMYDIDVGS